MSDSLFTKPPQSNVKLKLLIFGAPGTLKTRTALQMPKPAVIDMEKGTVHYTKEFEFFSLVTTSIAKVHQAVDEIITDPGEFHTIVLDSASVYWDFLQETHLKRLRVKKGSSSYVLAPHDYKAIKADSKSLATKLIAVDLNVIVTARDKTEYNSDVAGGDFMKVIGTKPDCPKEYPFIFDTVLELYKDGPAGKEVVMARVIKDRTNKLPDTFEYSFEKLEAYFGKDVIYRDVDKAAGQKRMEVTGNRSVETDFNGKKINTAGVTSDNLEKIKNLKIKLNNNEAFASKLNEDYSVSSVLDLKEDEAALFIDDLNNIIITKDDEED